MRDEQAAIRENQMRCVGAFLAAVMLVTPRAGDIPDLGGIGREEQLGGNVGHRCHT